MNKLNRRQFLKTLSFVGAGAAAVSVPLMKANAATESLFLVSSQPENDMDALSAILGEKQMASADVQTAPIVPAQQDLSFIQNGQFLDPVRNRVNNRISALADEMRRRKANGHVLVTLDFGSRRNSNFVEIEIDGEIIERIPAQRNYSDITIDGEHGATVFQLHNRILSVTQAGCRHKVCKKMGNITAGKIVCAPNKLVATINGSESGVDSITS
jgi:hypothetical protein